MPVPPLILLIHVLAVARLTLFVTADELSSGVRERAVNALLARGHDKLAYLVECPWCASIWIAAAWLPLMWFAGEHPAVVAIATCLAISQIVGMVAERRS